MVGQIQSHLQTYPCPTNINFLWNYGFLLGISYFIQILTGLILATRYVPNTAAAFDSVQHILREVNAGWLYRYLHSTGASIVFLVMFIHILRAMTGSYIYLPLGWLTGLILFYITIIVAFLGYVLPWGQMSYWGATVITNLLSLVPHLVDWILGGYYVSDPTLTRFYILHFVLPFIGLLGVILHIFYIHVQGTSNPLGYETSLKIPFTPNMLLIDIKGLNCLLLILVLQSGLGLMEFSHPDNSIPINRFQTPLQIVPEWYYLSFYTVLKVIPSKVGGLIVLLSSQLIWILYSEIRSFSNIIHQRQFYSSRESMDVASHLIYTFLILLIIGAQLPQTTFILYGRVFVIFLFLTSISPLRRGQES